jgi:hypothetical protein
VRNPGVPSFLHTETPRGRFVNADQLATHLGIDRYGDFLLTDAIRPAPRVPITPVQGYRVETYRDPESRTRIPMLAAAVSREQLFDVFLDLLAPLGDVVHVVLETSHGQTTDRHHDLRRAEIDLPVLASHFCEFEDMLVHDGCTGVAVLSDDGDSEVQFDEHKLLLVYARNRKPFRRVLRSHGIARMDGLKLISEAEHLHRSDARHAEQFQQLCYRIGAGDAEKVYTSESEE